MPGWYEEIAIADRSGIRPWEVDQMPAEWYYRMKYQIRVIEPELAKRKP